MLDRGLEWWSQRPLWQCGLALLGGWLFLGGLGPLVMVPVVGLCIFPVAVRAVDALEASGSDIGKAWRTLVAQFKKEWHELDPDRGEQVPVPAPAPPQATVVDPVTGVTVTINPGAGPPRVPTAPAIPTAPAAPIPPARPAAPLPPPAAAPRPERTL